MKNHNLTSFTYVIGRNFQSDHQIELKFYEGS
jgi:hypothetical protein